MRTAGKFLVYSAVLLRTVVLLAGEPVFRTVTALLAAYGLLLLGETWLVHTGQPGFLQSPRYQLTYLLLQSVLVLGLLFASSYEDFLAELFIPLSLDAVSFFGRRTGFRLIAAFSVAMTFALLFSSQGPLFGFTMGLLYSGICFEFGGYADQVQQAEAARLRNQQTFDELQQAHFQLRGYADRLASLAVERERNHLARDLHDSVTQTVFSMNLAAQSARLLWDREPARVESQLIHLEDLAAGAQREIQSLVSHLSQSPVVEAGLPAALRKLAEEQKNRSGLHVSLTVQGAWCLPEKTAAGLYAIAQEALINTAKHSGVSAAVVRLRLEKSRSCLEIEDSGRGFEPQSISAAGASWAGGHG